MKKGDRVYVYAMDVVIKGTVIGQIETGLYKVNIDILDEIRLSHKEYLYTIDRKDELIKQLDSDINYIQMQQEIIKGVKEI